MSSQLQVARGERAQGEVMIPWPEGMVDEDDHCLVALRVRVSQSTGEDDVKVVLDRPRVDAGPAVPTLHELIAYRFDPPACTILCHEVDCIGWIDPCCPLRLERVARTDPYDVFVEALILPFGIKEATRLAAMMRREPDPEKRHHKGWQEAEKLAERWEQRAPRGELPRRFLDLDFQVVRAQDAPLLAGRQPLQPAGRKVLPIVV